MGVNRLPTTVTRQRRCDLNPGSSAPESSTLTTRLPSFMRIRQRIGNESVPKNMINNTINLFFKTAISVLIVSNHNSSRVLFDRIATVYFI